MNPREIADRVKRFDGPAREMMCKAVGINMPALNDFLSTPDKYPDTCELALSWLRGEYAITGSGGFKRMRKGEHIMAGVLPPEYDFRKGPPVYVKGQGRAGFVHTPATNRGATLPTDREAALKAKHQREQAAEIAARKETNKPQPLGGVFWGNKGKSA